MLMSSRLIPWTMLGAVLAVSVGCTPLPLLPGIPMSPYFQDRKEDRFWEHERYERVPILGPITSGGPPRALDPPSDDEVMRALPSIEGGIPFLYERQRNNVRIVVELLSDYCDPPRVYPLIGPAIHHHAQYKCTIFSSETAIYGWPVPHTNVDMDNVQVVYIDHNHLHMVVDSEAGGNY